MGLYHRSKRETMARRDNYRTTETTARFQIRTLPDISPTSSIKTHALLLTLGFSEDPTEDFGSAWPELSYDFGNFKLSASCSMNRLFQDVVMLSGVMTTRRSIALVEYEMPLEIESFELGLALVTYCLDVHAYDGIFKPASPVAWVAEGRRYRHLLPWERDIAEYAARPHCYVQRDWARVALRDLAEVVSSVDNNSVIFQFDGDVLTIRCEGKVLAMPATGNPWPTRYSVRAELLRTLPRRLMRKQVEFSILESILTIGNMRYGGVESLATVTPEPAK
jgi:hypothetical protein